MVTVAIVEMRQKIFMKCSGYPAQVATVWGVRVHHFIKERKG
jgi:hypothetical protein